MKFAEEQRYPTGTRLLSESERVSNLESLHSRKRELINILEKLPVSMSTLSLINKKRDIENKLDEIDEAIEIFSKKHVFIKIDE